MENTIEVIINGFKENVPGDASIAELIVRFKEGDVDLIVEHNGRFVYPRQYDRISPSAGDRIEFINPNIGG